MFKQRWFPEMIQQHILCRVDKEQLNSHYYSTTYPDVYAAAERIFGSWGEAIESCGLDYNLIKRYKNWTRQTVLDEIRRLAQEGEPLFSKNAQNNHKPLYMAAIKRFGNWGKALQSAGVDYKSIRLRRNMTKAEIKKEVLALFRSGVSLSYMNYAGELYVFTGGCNEEIRRWQLGKGSPRVWHSHQLPLKENKIVLYYIIASVKILSPASLDRIC